jgi:hypothetical protein
MISVCPRIARIKNKLTTGNTEIAEKRNKGAVLIIPLCGLRGFSKNLRNLCNLWTAPYSPLRLNISVNILKNAIKVLTKRKNAHRIKRKLSMGSSVKCLGG